MTEKTIDWLNQNRFRAYPFVNDEGLVSGGTRIPDGILLDCTVFDTRRDAGLPELLFTRYAVSEDRTDVYFTYGGSPAQCTLYGESSSDSSGGADDTTGDRTFGEGSFVRIRATGTGAAGDPDVFLSLTFSSHAYIRERIGTGDWSFSGHVLPTRIVSTTASGVAGIRTGGSKTVRTAGTAAGTVYLEDGYRTQPCIRNGKVVVRVGTRYGEDPCHYPSESEEIPCEGLLLFFCGQNAINGGNVVLSGGPGVGVRQGTYTARQDIPDSEGNVGIAEGESVPCVEIVASSELLRIYRPTVPESGSSS